MTKSYLFLQGPIGPFFKLLAQSLEERGDKVFKINFNSADRFASRGIAGADYKGEVAQFGEFLQDVIEARDVTDVIIFGDSRPLHLEAIKLLKNTKLKIHIFEEGYFRPNWITCERNGVNVNSSLPNDRLFYDNWQKIDLPQDVKFAGSFLKMAWYTTTYYVTGLPGMYGEFKNYKHHFGVSPHKTIALWVMKLLGTPYRKLAARFKQREIVKLDYFIAPLQLCRDYQIKLHSQFRNMPNFIDYVVGNFALNASKTDHLVLKIHPLENNSRKLIRAVKESAARYGIKSRVKAINGGHLPTLISNSKGMVVVNSTSALSAMHHEKPVIALSKAIYNFSGLTYQGSLSDFWLKPELTDANLYQNFRNYVIYKTQINGSYYNRDGLKLALAGTLARLSEAEVVVSKAKKVQRAVKSTPKAAQAAASGR